MASATPPPFFLLFLFPAALRPLPLHAATTSHLLSSSLHAGQPPPSRLHLLLLGRHALPYPCFSLFHALLPSSSPSRTKHSAAALACSLLSYALAASSFAPRPQLPVAPLAAQLLLCVASSPPAQQQLTSNSLRLCCSSPLSSPPAPPRCSPFATLSLLYSTLARQPSASSPPRAPAASSQLLLLLAARSISLCSQPPPALLPPPLARRCSSSLSPLSASSSIHASLPHCHDQPLPPSSLLSPSLPCFSALLSWLPPCFQPCHALSSSPSPLLPATFELLTLLATSPPLLFFFLFFCSSSSSPCCLLPLILLPCFSSSPHATS